MAGLHSCTTAELPQAAQAATAGPCLPPTAPRSPPLHLHPLPTCAQGTVSGVLYYFPYQNDAETVPLENPLTSSKPMASPFRPGGATQRPAGTQLPRATQAPRATQLGGGGGGGLAAMEEDEEDEGPDAWQTTPIFEAFWQGRLIPGARIDTLPFVEAVRQKRTAQAKVGRGRRVAGPVCKLKQLNVQCALPCALLPYSFPPCLLVCCRT